jgi:hypothetical protein
MKNLEVSRNTLWQWRKTGRTALKFLPDLLALANISWQILSLHFSHLQYPRLMSEPHPTIP